MSAGTAAAVPTLTTDAFLGGRVQAVQSSAGHRSGLEAVLLGASLPATFAGTAVDFGSGAGIAGMCLAARAKGAEVVAADRDAAALAALEMALARPANAGFAHRVTPVSVDISAPEAERAAAGLGRAFADAVITNPPFYGTGKGTASPDPARAAAHVLGDANLEVWFRTAASILKPGGVLVVAFHAPAIGELLAGASGRFGGIAILPIHARAGRPAHRVLLRAVKGSAAPTSLLPGLILHADAGNAYLPEIEAVLRDGAGLAEVHPAWGD